MALAHSLNNKLSVILGVCTLLVDGHAKDHPECLAQLQKVIQTAQHMGDEINNYQHGIVGVMRAGAGRK